MKNQFTLLAVAVLVSACSHHPQFARHPSGDDELTPDEKEIASYNALFPYYAQVCTTTQYARRSGKFDDKGNEIIERGGNGGHATIFIKGACVDKSKGIPQLKICDSSVDLSHHDAGLGISVNKIFKNMNWVAIPGRKMFFHGGLGPQDNLSVEAYERIIQDVSKTDWHKGIVIDDDVIKKYADKFKLSVADIKKPENVKIYREIITRESIGTDFATTFARSAFCSRIPLPKDRLEKMITFMNDVNVQSSKKGFAWDGVYNNCAHLTSNAFAATGLFDFKATFKPVNNKIANKIKTGLVMALSGLKAAIGMMPDMSIPANNVIRMAEASFERKIDSASAAWFEKDNRRTLSDPIPWLPTSHGAMLEVMSIKPAEKNEMFVQGIDPVIAKSLLIKPQKKKYDTYKVSEDPDNQRFYYVEANLKYHLEKYRRISKNPHAVERQYADAFANRGPVSYGEFKKFYQNFYGTIGQLERDAEAKLSKLK